MTFQVYHLTHRFSQLQSMVCHRRGRGHAVDRDEQL